MIKTTTATKNVLDNLAVMCFTSGGVACNITGVARDGRSGTELVIPHEFGHGRLVRFANAYAADHNFYKHIDLPEYARGLCLALATVCGDLYCAWFENGPFYGLFYRSYIDMNPTFDISIQHLALFGNNEFNTLVAARELYYTPLEELDEEARRMRGDLLIVRHISDVFADAAEKAGVSENPCDCLGDYLSALL